MIWLLFGTVAISFSGVFVRLADVHPDVAVFYRMFFGGGALMCILAMRGGMKRIFRKAMLPCVLCGIFFLVDYSLWHRGVALLGPGMATLLGNFQVFIVAAYAALVWHEKLGRNFLFGAGTALAGLYLVVGSNWAQGGSGFQAGVLFCVGAATAYAGFIVNMKRALSLGAEALPAIAASNSLVAVLAFVLLAVGGVSPAIPTFEQGVWLVSMGLVCQCFGWLLITRGMSEVNAPLAALTLLLQPTLAYGWDLLLFEKAIVFSELGGAGLALCGIYLGSVRRK